MKKIVKYPLMPPFIIHAPKNAEWLRAGLQEADNGNMIATVWAIVDDAEFSVRHTFSCLGTGQPVPEHVDRYFTSLEIENGNALVHIFIDKPIIGER